MHTDTERVSSHLEPRVPAGGKSGRQQGWRHHGTAQHSREGWGAGHYCSTRIDKVARYGTGHHKKAFLLIKRQTHRHRRARSWRPGRA